MITININSLTSITGYTVPDIRASILSLGLNEVTDELNLSSGLILVCKALLERSGMSPTTILNLLHHFKDPMLKAGDELSGVLIAGKELPIIALEILDGRYSIFTGQDYIFDINSLKKVETIDNIHCVSYSLVLTGLFIQIVRKSYEDQSERRDVGEGRFQSNTAS